MTAPSGGPFFHDLIERVVIWEDSDDAGIAKGPAAANLAINTPKEASELPIQGLADTHTIDAAHVAGDGLAHGIAEAAHSDVVIDAHHLDAPPLAGEPDHGANVASHDDSTGSTSA